MIERARRPWPVSLSLVVLTLAAAGVLLWSTTGCLEPARSVPDAAPAERALGDARATPTPETDHEPERATLRRGETPDALLSRVGLDDGERREVLGALAGAVDFRRLRPGTGVALVRGDDGGLRSVALRPGPERYATATREADGWTVDWTEVPVDVTVRTAGGVIESSVAQALAHVPHARSLVADFADVFQWDVDLFVDPRPGDEVRIVHEVRRLGDLDPAAPGFRDLPTTPGTELGAGRILAASYRGRIASSDAYWVPDGEEGGGHYYDASGTPLRKAFLRSPLNYRRISSGFSRGRMHPVLRKVVPHHGVDFAANAGTPVVAAADGRVVSAGWEGALGKAVRIRHGNGFVTVYGHLRGFARGIRAGVPVDQNDVVGYVGSTGRATGPHLHYTMLVHGRPIDPLRFENPPVAGLPDELRPVLRASLRAWEPILASVRPGAESTSDIAEADAPTRPPTT